MFERFTEPARRAIFFARYEASQYGSPYIEPGHLLLGLLREDNKFFKARGLTRQQIEKTQALNKFPGERIRTSVDLPMANTTKEALSVGVQVADTLGSQRVSIEHLYAGVLKAEKEEIAYTTFIKELEAASNPVVKMAAKKSSLQLTAAEEQLILALRSLRKEAQ
jgi:ATP-dependent Clp protease ATP-binding subunit ClpC